MEKIRRSRNADLETLCTLESTSFQGDQLSRRRLRHWISAKNGCLLVAELTGAPCAYGLVIFRKNSDKGRIYSLAVSAQARGKGLGGALLAALECEAKRRQCRQTILEVSCNNHTAISLYTRSGYMVLANFPNYYEDGSDALRMSKDL
jgi:ribosomal protein S18 acetylase RimI-like enzyme